ncbi:MAG: GSCFA domain-containing protein [Saprospiraceae bacterium]
MMTFQHNTPTDINISNNKISPSSNILTLGSCFSQNIGQKLQSSLFKTIVNPFGTIFNPISICNNLDRAINNKQLNINDINNLGNRYFHYDFNTSFDSTDSKSTLEAINTTIYKTHLEIKKVDTLLLTFGTSIVYYLKTQQDDNDYLVSNCHKVPSTNFRKEILSVEQMKTKMDNTINQLRKINPDLSIILTVSPVRHTKEGLVANSRSKSRLIDLCHVLCEEHQKTEYFPAFEIMIDELRDYRYYKTDMIHPSDLAIDIIWDHFLKNYISINGQHMIRDLDKLNQASNHKPFDAKSTDYQKFKNTQYNKINSLKEKYPEQDFSQLETFFKA